MEKMMTLKTFLFTYLFRMMCACLVLLNSGCDEKQSASNRRNILIMGTSGDLPPFEFYKTAENKNQMVGFDIELAERISQYLGRELQVKDIDFSAIIPALQAGRIDFAMAGITASKERKKTVDFSPVYYVTANVLLTIEKSDFYKMKDFKGKKIAVQLGSTQEQFARFWTSQKPGLEIIALNRIGDIVQELKAKRIDGAILEESTAYAYVRNNPNTFDITQLESHQGGMAIAFPKNSPLVKEFERALQHLRDIGYVDKLVEKWFGAPDRL
ncbi:MAG: transporter substrate-binding domain-containing protein [Alphaproteobacteria bacterium]|nr:transporter substrate-binding domain-containing protein [Alphaproteobacteria bacterium]